jgi:hypothetical protein
MPKSYRIRTQVGVDKHINVKLEQDFDFLEILSLKINQSDIYIRPCSDYGVIVGRVSANNGFGLPNAKVSVFIPLSDEDENNPIISDLYPYKSLSDLNEDGYRYNLLPKEQSYSTHAATGTFPTKEEILIDQTQIEIYDKYYKFTAKTNDSGDYMIFGVPIGSQTLFMDIDLSDIGCFSLSPQDLIQAGLATEAQVSGSQFKTSSNLNELPQLITLNKIIDVSPLWGEPNICSLGITRCDFDLTQSSNISIQPTSVFMGSIISTTDDDALKRNCKPKNNTGNLCELVAGGGSIQAIRQTIFLDQQNLPILEEYQLEQNGNVIDGDGSYLVNIPMNLDYVITNEFGQQVISSDPTKGIPTKGRYRFKFKWNNEGGLQNQFLRANYLVPNIKEHGWTSSGNDPLDPNNSSTFVYTIPQGSTNGPITTLPGAGGLVLENTSNVEDFNIYINGVLYPGDPNVIPIPVGTIQIDANPTDPNLPQSFNFTYYQSDYFDMLRSYTFSLDWDDYVDPSSAINCNDTFYEFNYNKVYTTSQFLDRYKKGIGRAKHLGIKEIDNRTCKSTVNTFPVNDIIRNFDFIFFVFNILINILTIPIIVLLFVAHLILFIWPILKYLLVILGIYFAYDAVRDMIDWINSGIEAGAFSPLGGPVVNIGLYFRIAVQALGFVFRFALAVAFTIFTIKYLIRIKNFPRIGLPMISYPDCTTCDCDCKNASPDDDITTQSVSAEIEAQQNSDPNADPNPTLSQSNSFLAPIGISQSYIFEHPNYKNPDTEDIDSNTEGPFNNQAGTSNYPTPPYYDCDFKSLLAAASDQDIEADVVARALIDVKRLFSGYDVDNGSGTYGVDSIEPQFGNDGILRKAPQQFIFAAEIYPFVGVQKRSWAFPLTDPFPQKLNDFNTRDKFFSNVNKIRTTINPTLNSGYYEDQVVVILANPGTKDTIGLGNLMSFQECSLSNCGPNLTGATINQFNNNAITGTTLTGTTTVNVTYAATPTSNAPQVPFIINGNTLPDTFLQYPIDIEYFQLIEGFTVGDFTNLADFNDGSLFPKGYLNHEIVFQYYCGDLLVPPTTHNFNCGAAIDSLSNAGNYEVLIFVRGVDPNTPKQTVEYDISRILGNSFGTNVVTGEYYMNIPIQGVGVKPQSHFTPDNSNTNLYFDSYTFTIGNDFTPFTSTLPYYYLSTDDDSVGSQSYSPNPGFFPQRALQSSNGHTTNPNTRQLPYSSAEYFGGGSFIASNAFNVNPNYPVPLDVNGFQSDTPDIGAEGKLQIGYPAQQGNPKLYGCYSPSYIRQSLAPINFSNKNKIVMRSDRLPTSTKVEFGVENTTSYALHQNNNFTYYSACGQQASPTIGIASDLPAGENIDSDLSSSILDTLTCEKYVPLECYQGTGTNVTINPNCSIPSDRVVQGCYCLLNKQYLFQVDDDVRLFLEWKTRFTITFAACRGVFAQVFQNNWINGVLYMFNFNKTAIYSNFLDTTPQYSYCEDVIVFNDLENNFYYRSSPWDGTKFIGKNPPSTSGIPTFLLNGYPGVGYNTKQIQFPTTITDMGPREAFISEICNNDNFNGYSVDQFKSTSYQDNSSIIQLGFLSRLLNDRFRQAIIPITNPSGGNTEGKGIIQFFNSTREGDRIDGDFAQMLSINSEWKISPFLVENYPNPNSIFFGEDLQSGDGYPRPVFGVFFETDDLEYIYRRRLTPGYEYYSLTPPVFYQYGYPKTQDVPNYRWKLENQSAYIFGNENNNWDTDVTITGGFFTKGYQDLDYNVDPYFQSSNFTTTQRGYITKFTAGNPDAVADASVTALGNSIIVGAPNHFYFGLNNGKTAIDKFVKLYIFNPDA